MKITMKHAKLFFIIFFVITLGLYIHPTSLAQDVGEDTIKFGTFEPVTVSSTPTTKPKNPNADPIAATPDAECRIPDAEDRIARFSAHPMQFWLKHQKILEEEVRTYLSTCSDIDEGCTKDPGLLESSTQAKISILTQMSTRLFGSDHPIYVKTLARYSMRQGFGLSNSGLDEMVRSLGKDCDFIIAQLTKYVVTPLYFYPAKKMQVSLFLNSQPERLLQLYPDGTIEEGGVRRLSIHYDVVTIRLVSNKEGRIIMGNNLAEGLSRITDELSFTKTEADAFVREWVDKLPKANYYRVSLFSQEDARDFAPWSVYPSPDTEIRYIFSFTPLVEKPANVQDAYYFLPIERSGFTVVDIGGIVNW